MFGLNNKKLKEQIKNNIVIDPLLVVAANKGYKWLISDGICEKDAAEFEKYIMCTTSREEISEIRANKSLRDFLTGKYVEFLAGV